MLGDDISAKQSDLGKWQEFLPMRFHHLICHVADEDQSGLEESEHNNPEKELDEGRRREKMKTR
jgi:hypothetical protein